MSSKRDIGLIVLTGILVMTAMVCTTFLVIHANIDSAAAFGVITAGVGIGGVALGRLSGANSGTDSEDLEEFWELLGQARDQGVASVFDNLPAPEYVDPPVVFGSVDADSQSFHDE